MSSLAFAQETDWKLQKDAKGIKVYTRKVPGETLKAFRAVTLVDASADQVLGEITDVEQGAEWMDRCAESHLVQQEGPDVYLAYTLIDVPWPLDDRDLVTRVQIRREKDRIICTMSNVPDAVPVKRNVIRMPRYEGQWVLIPQDNGQTQVISEGISSPGGTIPDWLANSEVVESPYNTLSNLRDRLE